MEPDFLIAGSRQDGGFRRAAEGKAGFPTHVLYHPPVSKAHNLLSRYNDVIEYTHIKQSQRLP